MKAKLILESLFYNIQSDDILTHKYFNHLKKEGVFDNYENLYKSYYNIDEDQNIDYDDLLDFIKDEFIENFENTKENIFYLIKNEKLPIFRAITVDKNWLEHLRTQGKRLGVYWTWDERAAETHWGYDPKKYTAILKSEINIKYIDWITTFELNSHPYYTEEKEIRLYKNTPINLKFIKINNKLKKLDYILKNKTFYA